ncbi:M24 family metallopeptidase [bacterium]|nr:M24 family metallopeptidase [bacterium]
MNEEKIRFLLVNSTNEFLVEYNTLEENSRYKLTNFSGSTGEALVTQDNIFLFVDGRYHIQADLEVDHEKITAVKLQTGSRYLDELLKYIPENEILGIFSKKNSQKKYEFLKSHRQIKLLENDPLDKELLTFRCLPPHPTPLPTGEGAVVNELCELYNGGRGLNIINEKLTMPLDKISNKNFSQNIVLNKDLTGLTSEEKISKISQNLSDNEGIYITDLDEVSYLFNMRNFSQVFSAKIRGKCLIFKNNTILFVEEKLNHLPEFLKSLDKEIFIDKSTITAFDYSLLKFPKEIVSNPIKIMKSQKNSSELKHLKDAFERTDRAVRAIRDFIEQNDNISEFDIAVQLAKEYKNNGAVGLSFNSIVARNENSALAHYSKSSKNEIIKDGDLVLIDCGGYFEGGLATDITRVFVKGEPSALHKKIYTLVLKAFLNAYNYTSIHPQKTITGYEIDNSVHDFFNNQDTEGFVFNHGLGHGIGINVHEYPPNLSQNEIAKTPIIDGMCFSIEPGLYKEGFFGVRLENSCYFLENKIHSFVKMNFEKKLINFEMLTAQESQWLNEFEVK